MRPKDWEDRKVMRSWGKLTLEGEYEAGADAMHKADIEWLRDRLVGAEGDYFLLDKRDWLDFTGGK